MHHYCNHLIATTVTALIFIHVLALPCRAHEASVKHIPIALACSSVEDPLYTCWLKSVYSEIFNGLGFTLYVQEVPIARASDMISKGTIDGILCRPFIFGQDRTDIVRLKHIVRQVRISTVTNNPGMDFKSWQDLVDSGLIIGSLRGSKMVQIHLKNALPKERLKLLNNVESAFRMMEAHRLDVFVARDSMIRAQLRTNTHKDIHWSGDVFISNAHTYLISKHAPLAARITARFLEMKESGDLRRIAEECGYSMADDTPE